MCVGLNGAILMGPHMMIFVPTLSLPFAPVAALPYKRVKATITPSPTCTPRVTLCAESSTQVPLWNLKSDCEMVDSSLKKKSVANHMERVIVGDQEKGPTGLCSSCNSNFI